MTNCCRHNVPPKQEEVCSQTLHSSCEQPEHLMVQLGCEAKVAKTQIEACVYLRPHCPESCIVTSFLAFLGVITCLKACATLYWVQNLCTCSPAAPEDILQAWCMKALSVVSHTVSSKLPTRLGVCSCLALCFFGAQRSA